MNPSTPPSSAQEAAAVLRDISQTAQRSAQGYGNRMAAPHLLLWGVIWAIGYGLSNSPRWTGPAWWVLVPAGMIGSTWLGMSMPQPAQYHLGGRYWATALTLFGFFAGLFAILPPSGEQVGAVVPLVAAAAYVLYGIWKAGARMLWTGIAVAALTLAGFFGLHAHFAVWMAVVGGGGLMLGGLWMRSA